MAGDKPKLDAKARALPLPDKAAPVYGKAVSSARRSALALPTDLTLRGAPIEARFVRLSDKAGTQARRFDYAEAEAPSAWRLTDREVETTGAAGGSYAVGDILSSQRKPRFRKSPLGALLVFRIDGKDESPPFSVGGGGVAAAVWKAMPR